MGFTWVYSFDEVLYNYLRIFIFLVIKVGGGWGKEVGEFLRFFFFNKFKLDRKEI